MMASPAVNKTKELVHKDLLMGKKVFQINPATASKAPMFVNRSIWLPVFSLSLLSQVPVSTPIKQVPMAGIVPSNPSGSQVFDAPQRWFGVNTSLSSQANP